MGCGESKHKTDEKSKLQLKDEAKKKEWLKLKWII